MAIDPMTAIGLGSAAFGFAGSRSARRAQARARRAAARQRIREAAFVRQRTDMRVEQFERQMIREQGARVAAFGANGIVMSGSALEVMVDATREATIARQAIEFEGEGIARALEDEATALLRGGGSGSALSDFAAALNIAAPFIPSILSGNTKAGGK